LKGHNFHTKLGFDYGSSVWKDLTEKKVMDVLEGGFEMIGKSENLIPIP
jgi:hypothetical protein